jgi:hypothetical protein
MFLLAQLPVDPVTAAALKSAVEGADFLNGKDVKWWFAFVLIIGGALGLIVLKWLLASHQKYIATMEIQLTEQRTANKELNGSLLNYITTDHFKSMETMNRVGLSLDKLADAINNQKSS